MDLFAKQHHQIILTSLCHLQFYCFALSRPSSNPAYKGGGGVVFFFFFGFSLLYPVLVTLLGMWQLGTIWPLCCRKFVFPPTSELSLLFSYSSFWIKSDPSLDAWNKRWSKQRFWSFISENVYQSDQALSFSFLPWIDRWLFSKDVPGKS